MATITKTGAYRTPTFTHANGNATILQYSFQTNASGVAIPSDSAVAVGAGDVIRLGQLQAGLLLIDSLAIVSAVLVGAFKVGFAYVSGVDNAKFPQKDDYFNAALAGAALGRTRLNNNASAPAVLPEDAFLIITPAAAQTVAGKLDIFVEAVWQGNPNT
jgi:hypothetical protein